MEKYKKVIEFYKGCISSWEKRHYCPHDEARRIWSAELAAIEIVAWHDTDLTDSELEEITKLIMEA